MTFISAVYVWPLTEVTSTTVVIGFVLPSMICSKQGVSCHVYFNSIPGNWRCTLAFRLHTPSSIFIILKFKCAHLKFTVYGRKQGSKQAYTRIGFGRLCSHFYPLFYSFIPINFTYYSQLCYLDFIHTHIKMTIILKWLLVEFSPFLVVVF